MELLLLRLFALQVAGVSDAKLCFVSLSEKFAVGLVHLPIADIGPRVLFGSLVLRLASVLLGHGSAPHLRLLPIEVTVNPPLPAIPASVVFQQKADAPQHQGSRPRVHNRPWLAARPWRD